MANKTKKKAIIVSGDADASNYLVITTGLDEVQDLMQETVGEEGIAPHEFDRAENPSGKSLKWGIPTIEGELEMVGEIEGVILHHQFKRAYWLLPYGEGDANAMPDCSSIDGKTGVGNPGGICTRGNTPVCPFAHFGSAKNNSQACTLTKHIFVLREDELLPLLVVITPGSLKSTKAYFRRLLSQQIRPTNLITKLKLTGPIRSRSGYDHAVAELSLAGKLDEETAAKMREYAAYLKPWLRESTTQMSDVRGDDGGADNVQGKADEDAFDGSI